MRTPLAWKNLTSSWNKCLLSAAGVGFAVVLMFMQIGFSNALIDSNVQIFNLFDLDRANIAVVSRARYTMSTELRFPRQLLEQLAANPQVVSFGSASIDRATSRIRIGQQASRPIRVIAVDPGAEEMLADAQLKERFHRADRAGSCLVDTESKSFYNFASTVEALSGQSLELNGYKLKADGFFFLGTDFSNDASLLMSQQLHAGYYPWRSPTRQPTDLLDIGLLQVAPQPGESLDDVAAQLQSQVAGQAKVLATKELIRREKQFWGEVTPIGKIFFIGTLMGLAVGAIICYQIQFTDITDHMAEFATLKAMGYGTGYFWRLVLSQSIYLAGLGFVPGLVVAYALYQILARSSGLTMMMSWDRILIVWCLTLVMCFLSGSLAIGKLFNSDPANLF
jgi:putative ABC transport system permease protein